jgi:hypothetical protein
VRGSARCADGSSRRRAELQRSGSSSRSRETRTLKHYAAHQPIDVRAVDADLVLCSSYKWCGPHLGLAYERRLGERFLARLPEAVAVYGLPTMRGRVPTFLVNVDGVPAREVALALADRGYGVWHHDNWYSVGLVPRLPYDDEAVRIGDRALQHRRGGRRSRRGAGGARGAGRRAGLSGL